MQSETKIDQIKEMPKQGWMQYQQSGTVHDGHQPDNNKNQPQLVDSSCQDNSVATSQDWQFAQAGNVQNGHRSDNNMNQPQLVDSSCQDNSVTTSQDLQFAQPGNVQNGHRSDNNMNQPQLVESSCQDNSVATSQDLQFAQYGKVQNEYQPDNNKNQPQLVDSSCKDSSIATSPDLQSPQSGNVLNQHRSDNSKYQPQQVDTSCLDNSGDVTSEQETIITINNVKSCAVYHVPVQVQDQHLEAVIDTAAESTILSDKIYNKLDPKPRVLSKMKFHMAGRNLTVNGFKIGPVNMRIGSTVYREIIHVAPIEDDMLLGIDFLMLQKMKIDMETNLMTLGKDTISIHFGREHGEPRVSRVKIAKRKVIPPNSVAMVTCKMNENMPDFTIEPESDSKFVVPRSAHRSTTKPSLYVANVTDNFMVLKKGQIIGQAIEADVVPETENGDTESSAEPIQRESHVRKTETRRPDEQSKQDEDPYADVPEHLIDMLKPSENELTKEEFRQLKEVICHFSDVFASHIYDLGNFQEIEHTINTGDAKPIKQRMRRTPVQFAGEEEKELSKMLEAGVVQPSISEWASAPVLVRKRDGTVRFCIDYRALNNATVKDVYPLPLVEDCVDTLSDNIWFSKLDAIWGYWQVNLQEEDRRKTAFITKYRLYEFVKMTFGLCNSPSTFSRVINLVLRGLNWKTALAFLDDIVILGKNFQDHLENLVEALNRFRQYGLKLKPKKCTFCLKKVEFLGRIVGENSIEISEKDIEAVKEWPTPKNTKDVERFLGLANYHRSFIQNFAELAVPLYGITGKKAFHWGTEQEEAFRILKYKLVTPPVLTIPNARDEFILDTDASNTAVGGELLQIQDGEERVIAYASYALTPEQRRYCTTRLELLAIVRLTRQFRHHLLGKPFTIRTDHNSLTWLLRFKEPQGQLARWIEELSQYNMVLKHRKGSLHANADGLSRTGEVWGSHYVHGIDLKDLPCGGCSYCTRAHTQWSSFIEDIDDVIPIANCQKASLAAAGEGSDSEASRIWDPGGVTEDGETPTLETVIQQSQVGCLILQVNTISGSGTINRVVDLSDKTGSCWGLSMDEIRQEQNKDRDLKPILNWLNSQTQPSEGELFLQSPAVKFYWINQERLVVRNDILFFKAKDSDQDRLILPEGLKETAFRLHHDIPSAGHQGIKRTKFRIKERFFWYSMGKDIEMYVASCEMCNQRKKPTRHNRYQLVPYHAGIPMERVHMDFVGPLPRTKQGNEHILMMVDQFTKWVEIIPLPSQKAEVTAQAAVNSFFSRFGVPLNIFTDQGRNFESGLFSALCSILQIHKTRTTAYRPSSNGQSERYNRTLMDAVRCFVGKRQNDWDVYIPQLAGAIRATVNRSTGQTPNFMMFGREINIPADLMFASVMTEESMLVNEYIQQLVVSLKESHQIARKKLKETQKRMKKNYDLRILEKTYETGDKVYVQGEAVSQGICKKIAPPWKGPGIIIEKITPYLFRIQIRNKVMLVNHDKIKLCRDRQLPAWLLNFQIPDSLASMGDVQDTDKHCICKQPWGGQFMIQCDYCDIWFHGSCVNVAPSDALDIDKYKCPGCTGPTGLTL